MVENQSACRMKRIRSDRGKEYTSNVFDKFCDDEGVEHQLTVGYTPQQNGVSERKNKIVMEMARCILFKKKMPKGLWAETINTVVYLLNRCPTKVVRDKTPCEAWVGEKPIVKHLIMICLDMSFHLKCWICTIEMLGWAKNFNIVFGSNPHIIIIKKEPIQERI